MRDSYTSRLYLECSALAGRSFIASSIVVDSLELAWWIYFVVLSVVLQESYL
jgi:hypothetical protein